MEKMAYAGWRNCVRLANSEVEVVITTDVGPRIIRYGFSGRENELKEYPEQLGLTGGREWRIYGGHRLWHAPESQPRTYWPDNAPVKVEALGGAGVGARFLQEVEKSTGIEKQLEVRVAACGSGVRILHRLSNRNLWPVELAPWALMVMAPGGTAIFPLPPRGTHPENLLPANTLTLWAYTDLSDPRWTLGRQFILLANDPRRKTPQKLGLQSREGWMAYARAGRLFVKKHVYQEGATYPDGGCSVETFTNHEMLELETLGPLARLEPGETVEHLEEWELFQGVRRPGGEADVAREILPFCGGVPRRGGKRGGD